MNRRKRKAIKMFRRRYGKSVNPIWRSQGLQSQTDFTPEMVAQLRVVSSNCRRLGR